jgi:hypothetical protein
LTNATRTGAVFAFAHFIAYAASFFLTSTGSSWNSFYLIVFWQFADFPISLILDACGGIYHEWIGPFLHEGTILGQLLWFSNIVDGLLGSLWWFAIPRFFPPKSSGGFRAESVARTI